MQRAIVAPVLSTPETALMTVWAKSLALARGDHAAAVAIAEQRGAPARLINVLKAAVGAHGTNDAAMTGMVDVSIISTTFVSTLRNKSLFYTLLADGLTRVPLRTRASFLTATATAFVAGEGAAVPVSRMAADQLILDPIKACALIIFTDEMMKAMGSAGEALLARELRRGVARCVDDRFLQIVVDGDTPVVTSTGDDAAAATIGLRALLDAVAPTSESKLLWAMSADVGRRAATLQTTAGGFLFPEMGPTGGAILNTPALVSDSLASGTMLLIDATGIAGDSESVLIDSSHETTIEMANPATQNSTTPTGSTMVSMFQTNSTAVLAKAYFAAERLRDNAVAKLTGIAWGDVAPPAS